MAPRRNRKEDLLNAAELLFAAQGYHGASMRDIARAAGVQLGLCTYYFTTKEQLYQEVLNRRSNDLTDLHESSLSDLIARDPRPGIEAIVEAFIAPQVRLVLRDIVWRRYMQILYQLAAFEERKSLGAWMFPPHEHVVDIYVAALREALPEADPAQVRIAFMFVRVLTLSFIANAASDTAPPDPARFPPEALSALIRFAVAGLRAAVASAGEGSASQRVMTLAR
jgi:AcrR family transcriptional regulator